MNKDILNTDIQNFINKNLLTDILSILLKRHSFEKIELKEIVEQIEAKKRCQKKLPSWFETENIYYPNKLNIEQSSSEITANYKSDLVNGNSLIDLSGGFGVDSFFFSKKIKQVIHCEINEMLSTIVSHNFKQLQISTIETKAVDGISYLEKHQKKFDWIYIDPSKRSKEQKRVFFLSDCEPNVPKNLELLFSKSNAILIKTSPLLDINAGIKELQYVKEIHSVAINNDVKELLWILEKGFSNEISMKTINFKKSKAEIFEFQLSEEIETQVEFSTILHYLYEPNATILKAGAFKTICKKFPIHKIHVNSHLYTSNELIDFPGRKFKVQHTTPYNKKKLLQLISSKKVNITTRNFPETVSQIRKKTGLKDGGNLYLFCTTNHKNEHIVIICEKVN